MNLNRAGAYALLLALASTLASAQTTQAPQTPPAPTDKDYFTVLGTGFAFVRPPTWKVEKLKREQRLTIPTTGKHGAAIMHFYTVDFRYKTSDWQDTQITVATEFKRSVDRQWQEDVLGIPLLLTKTSGVDSKGVPDVVLTGLLYSATKNKMLFRLTCPAEDYDEANSAWRSAFQTLRTTDGSQAQADDPNKKLSKDQLEPKPTGPLPVTQVGTDDHATRLVKGPVTVPGKAGGKNALIHLPAGWKAAVQKDGSWLLTGPGLSGLVTMSLASTLDSDPVDSALNKLSAVSLDDFKAVSDRTDVDGRPNKAGGTCSAIYRVGTSAKGPLTSFEAAVATGDLYVLFHWEGPSLLTPSLRNSLDQLLKVVTIDGTP